MTGTDQAVATVAPKQKQDDGLRVAANKAIAKVDHFPTIQDIADQVMANGFSQVKTIKGLQNKLVKLIEAGELDDALRASGKKHSAAPKRVSGTDKLGRKGHRKLALGMILREGRGFRVCGKTTKDLTDAKKEQLVKARKKGASWGELSKRFKLEHNNGMTARNIYLVIERSKGR